MSFSDSEENQGRGLESDDEHGVTAIVRRYRGDPGNTTAVPGDPFALAGELRGSDVLADTDLDVEGWEREHHPDADRTVLTKTEMYTGLQSAEELCPEDHPDNDERLPGTHVDLIHRSDGPAAIPNAKIVACRAATGEADGQ